MTSKRIKQSTVEASEWFAAQRQGELGSTEQARFADWLCESPAHLAEYLELAELWEEMGSGDALASVDVDAEVAKAQNIVELGSVTGSAKGSGGQSPTVRRRDRSRIGWGVAAGLFITFATLGWLGFLDRMPDDMMTTAIGEQRSVTLADGSVISLNTQTSVRVTLSADGRRAELLQGEALFDIARDEQRPFIVIAGSTEVRVLGTTFNVYREDSQHATVTVLEGRVTVSRSDLSAAPSVVNPVAGNDPSGSVMPQPPLPVVELTRGQTAHVSNAGAVVEPEAANLEKAVAWTERRLIFEDTALKDVLAEFNRYNTKTLRVDDPTLATLQLNGVFESHDPDSLLEYLERSQGVRIRELDGQRIVERR